MVIQQSIIVCIKHTKLNLALVNATYFIARSFSISSTTIIRESGTEIWGYAQESDNIIREIWFFFQKNTQVKIVVRLRRELLAASKLQMVLEPRQLIQ